MRVERVVAGGGVATALSVIEVKLRRWPDRANPKKVRSVLSESITTWIFKCPSIEKETYLYSDV